jgi:hypothetical protein
MIRTTLRSGKLLVWRRSGLDYHRTKQDELHALLSLPQPYTFKLGLLTAAAMAGEIIPADTLLAGIRELLDLAERDSWRLDENRGELMGWVELFPFSDRPNAVLDALELLPAEHRYAWRLRRLLSALGDSPHPDALQVLEALARRDAQLLKEHDWLNAMIKVGTEESARALLVLACDGTLMSDRRGVDPWQLSQRLARLGEEFPVIRDEMLRRYQRMSGGQPKAIIESALAELAEAPIVLALIRSYAVDNRPFDGRLAKAVRDLAVGRRPAGDWPGAYEEFSMPLTALRKELFRMFVANDIQSTMAEACLIAIEELRDEHGRIDDEPRHPDIESGLMWPKEALETGIARGDSS